MPELQLISSKRDIYFATTAPEFIPKDFRIGCLENDSEASVSRRPSRINEFSNERILEIRHKIDKIEAQQRNHMDYGEMQHHKCNQRKSIPLSIERFEQPIHINADDNFSKFLPLPRNDQSPSFQRARSLQKPKDKNLTDESKRLISKSNSCGDSCTAHKTDHDYSSTSRCMYEPSVPPNSPKVNSSSTSSHSPNSPTKIRLLKSPNNNKFIHSTNTNAEHTQSTEKPKPLRIFRIPLFNLTGTHSHYHIHNSTPKASIKIPPRKIEEDGLESADVDETDATDASDSNGIEANDEQTRDLKQIKTNLQKLSTNCTNLSLFSSI